MARTSWGKHCECSSCGKESTHWFRKAGLFRGRQEITYCKECLLKRLKAEKFEEKAIKWI